MQLLEKIEVNRSVEDCYAYLLDFSSAAEWDPGVKSAKRVSLGPICEGATFEVVCHLPVGSVQLEYTLLESAEPFRIKLVGKSSFFTVEDTIEIEPIVSASKGSHVAQVRSCITYTANFTFNELTSVISGVAKDSMVSMGRKALEGLRVALEDIYPTPVTSYLRGLGDRLVLPGMAAFSSLGYKQTKTAFNPISNNMHGKHIVLTGASSGIGFAAAEQLAARGAKLTLVMRNETKAKQAIQSLVERTGNEHISLQLADLSLLADTTALARRLKRQGKPIDVLINNAGALFEQQRNINEGLDESLALLLLSPYKLAIELKGLLEKSDDPRIINVVSGGMYTQRLNLRATLNPKVESFSGSVVYARAKRALMIATEELASDWANSRIAVNAMHPGWADTPGVEGSLPGFYRLTKNILRTPEQGADSIDWMASATEAGRINGQLILDRLPRDRYLIPGTKETWKQRQELMTFLERCSKPEDVLAYVHADNTVVA